MRMDVLNKIGNKIWGLKFWQKLVLMVLVFIVIAFIMNVVNKAIHNYQSGVVTNVCTEYFSTNMGGTDTQDVSIVGNYDSDGDGRGTCDIYKQGGEPIAQLSCDATFPKWMNTGNCKNTGGKAGIRTF